MSGFTEAYFRQLDRTRQAEDRHQEFMLALVAGEPITLFGKPVEITFTWPEGLPAMFADEAAFRAEMARWLAEHRARSEKWRAA